MSGQIPEHGGPIETPPPVPPAPAQGMSFAPSGFAITAFVLGILSFVTCGPCLGIPALVFGLIELQKISNRTSSVEGRPFALAGVILGGISCALAVLVILIYVGIIFFAIMSGLSAT